MDVPPLVARAQLLSDTHDSLGHCGRDKLLSALCSSYWWPGMHADVADCVRCCAICQRDKPPAPPKEELRWTDKGGAPLSDGASTWRDHFHETKTEIAISSSPWIHSQSGWKSAPCPLYTVGGPPKFLYDDLVARWGKPRYVRTDNGAEFAGSFARLCKGLGIIHHHITVGNSKANGQVEADDQDAEGLYPAWPDQDARNLSGRTT